MSDAMLTTRCSAVWPGSKVVFWRPMWKVGNEMLPHNSEKNHTRLYRIYGCVRKGTHGTGNQSDHHKLVGG
jgi:hypothetical protein